MAVFNFKSLRNTVRQYEKELIRGKDWLFVFLLIWTLIIIALQISEFLGKSETPHGFHTAYIVLLAAYITHKELNRWIGLHMKIRYGEFFVVIWWGLLFGMLLTEQFGKGSYHLPREMLSTCYHVLGAFLVAEISKATKAYQTRKICQETEDEQ